jgi:hypothetical protein
MIWGIIRPEWKAKDERHAFEVERFCGEAGILARQRNRHISALLS